MNSIIATHVVVQFIGLFLFFSPTPNDSVVHVELPPIPSYVFPHAAVVLYQHQAELYHAGWSNAPGHLGSWDFLEFDDHDRIAFSDPLQAKITTLPSALTHLRDCGNFQALKPGFDRPSFSDARAVVDIPYGVIDSVSLPSADGQGRRVDTRLTFNNDGPVVVTVTGKTASRVLVLKPGGCLVIAHIARSLLTGVGTYDTDDENHFGAYLAMSATQNVFCNGLQLLMSQKGARVVERRGKTGKDLDHALMAARQSNQKASPFIVETLCGPIPFLPGPPRSTINGDCSNSQWP